MEGHRMRATSLTLAAVIAVGLTMSVQAENVAQPLIHKKAINENNLAAYGEHYASHRSCGYYRYVCRAWWTGCAWEGPYSFPLNRYWGFRYICW
jgi:hypothetical protein